MSTITITNDRIIRNAKLVQLTNETIALINEKLVFGDDELESTCEAEAISLSDTSLVIEWTITTGNNIAKYRSFFSIDPNIKKITTAKLSNIKNEVVKIDDKVSSLRKYTNYFFSFVQTLKKSYGYIESNDNNGIGAGITEIIANYIDQIENILHPYVEIVSNMPNIARLKYKNAEDNEFIIYEQGFRVPSGTILNVDYDILDDDSGTEYEVDSIYTECGDIRSEIFNKRTTIYDNNTCIHIDLKEVVEEENNNGTIVNPTPVDNNPVPEEDPNSRP